MGRVVVFMSLTLDGVMQSPGRPDEDTRGGFEHGGWGVRYADSVSGSMVGRYAGTTEGLLLGRRTYEDFFQVWPNRTDNPFTEALNKAQKYVASKMLSEPLPWVNSTLLKGDASRSVAGLKQRLEKDLMASHTSACPRFRTAPVRRGHQSVAASPGSQSDHDRGLDRHLPSGGFGRLMPCR